MIKGLSRITLSVSDPPRSLAFYLAFYMDVPGCALVAPDPWLDPWLDPGAYAAAQ